MQQIQRGIVPSRYTVDADLAALLISAHLWGIAEGLRSRSCQGESLATAALYHAEG
jgi:hypothetical protein